MKFSKILALVLCGSSSFAVAATFFSSTELTYTAPNDTLNNVGDSVTYFIAMAGDTNVSWSNTSATGANSVDNNPDDIPAFGRLTLTSLTGTGSITIGGASATNSFDVTSSGNIGTFTVRLEYLNASGGSLGMSGRLNNATNFGPMAHVVALNNFETQDVTLSVLDGNNAIIDDYDFIPLNGGTWRPQDTSPVQTPGAITFDLDSVNDRGNIGRFDDATPGDATDDLFSGAEITLIPDDGTFADGSSWSFSFDSAVIAPQGVPEPSASLLAALTGLLVLRRKR